MGTNITGIGNANAIGFKSRVTGGTYFPSELKELYPAWESFFDKIIKVNTIVNYEGNLYRCIVETSPVREGATPVDSIENYELIE